MQQQAALPGVYGACALVLVFGLACAPVVCVPQFRAVSMIEAACVAGFGYSVWRADTRLQRALPVAFENRNIELTGFVRGLPMQDAHSTRLLFEIESNHAALTSVPRVVAAKRVAVEDGT